MCSTILLISGRTDATALFTPCKNNKKKSINIYFLKGLLLHVIFTYKNAMICRQAGVKKSLVLEPGTSKISGRTSIYFHPMSGGQVKNSV